MRNFLVILLVLGLTTGCALFDKKPGGASEKQLEKENRAEIALKAIESNKKVLDNKASALVFGSKYTLEQETNKTPRVEVSLRFIELATLTLEKPSVKDANLIMEISDGLVKGYREEAELAKKQAAEAQGRAAISDKEKDEAKIAARIASDLASKARQEHLDAEKKLALFTKDITVLQEREKSLIEKADKAELALKEFARENSGKAEVYDEENSFLNSINPFYDLMKFVKKLFTLSIVCVILFIVFKVVEIFCPALSIVSGIAGMILSVFKKLVPKAFSMVGMVSSSALDALRHVVKSQDDIFKKLKNEPFEQELIQNYPDSYQFNKKEVLDLLNQLTEKTVDSMEIVLSKVTNEESRGVITQIKQEIKGEKPANLLV